MGYLLVFQFWLLVKFPNHSTNLSIVAAFWSAAHDLCQQARLGRREGIWWDRSAARAGQHQGSVMANPGWQFNSIGKETEKGTKSPFANQIPPLLGGISGTEKINWKKRSMLLNCYPALLGGRRRGGERRHGVDLHYHQEGMMRNIVVKKKLQKCSVGFGIPGDAKRPRMCCNFEKNLS